MAQRDAAVEDVEVAQRHPAAQAAAERQQVAASHRHRIAVEKERAVYRVHFVLSVKSDKKISLMASANDLSVTVLSESYFRRYSRTFTLGIE